MEQQQFDSDNLFHAEMPGGLIQADGKRREPVRFREGGRIGLKGGPDRSTASIFQVALAASLALGGQPVRCSGLVPAVSMRVGAGDLQPADGEDAERILSQVWEAVHRRFVEWLTADASPAGMSITVSPDIRIEFGRDGRYVLRPGVMQIDVGYNEVFAASFERKCTHCPLIEPQLKQAAPAPPPTERTALRHLIGIAVQKTIRADDPLYERLPVPVRYRATGAIDAWRQVRDAAGRSGADLSQRLALYPVGALLDNFPRYLETWTRNDPSCIDGPDGMGHSHRSLVWQIFSACQGVLYEPTPPLHRLLDAAYIADDVPVGMIRLPVDAMCIIPDPSWWGHREGVEAIALFHRKVDSDGSPHESLGCVTWSQYGGQERRVRMQVMEFSLSDPHATIRQMFDNTEAALEDPDEIAASAAMRRHWEGVLDYVIKMLLYLTVRDAHVVHDRAYTEAPREFGGLGKRKRAERLAQIEMLYDRHLVGPAILDAEVIASIPTDGEHHEVRGHWRRPHFRMQPYGPHSSLRKLAFIGPTLVRPDRLGL
jgi:hypothetical protein